MNSLYLWVLFFLKQILLDAEERDHLFRELQQNLQNKREPLTAVKHTLWWRRGRSRADTHCTDAMQTHCTKTEEHFALSAPPFCLLSIFILVYIKSIYIYPRRLMRLEGKKLLFSVEWVRWCDCFLEGEMFGVSSCGWMFNTWFRYEQITV